MVKIGEAEALDILRRTFGAYGPKAARGNGGPKGATEKSSILSSDVLLGIGDDAAVLGSGRGQQVWTIDACLEGVHFLRVWMSPEDVGYKGFQSAVSDLAAMGARPRGALCQITLAPWMTRSDVQRFARGQARAASELGCPIIGGNITGGKDLQCVTTALGEVTFEGGPLLRSGAQPGEELWLVGDVGLARLGYLCLEKKRLGELRSLRGHMAVCVRAFRRPRALLREGKSLLGRASAAMDLSDGLRRDVPRMAIASGVRIVVDERELLRTARPELAGAAARLQQPVADAMIGGGEDYALLASGPASLRPRWARRIGRVEAGEGAFISVQGQLTRLTGGFEH